MRGPYPNRRRKRKGRRPPHRYKGDGFPIRPTSFQDFGLKTIYDLFLPKLGVHNRRRHCNQLGSSIVLGMGYSERFWVSRWPAPLEPFSEELDWRLGIIPSESIALFAEFTSPITGLDGHGESRGCPGSLLFSYQGEIARSQNGARIAGNHALLAAASEQFADCLSDVWASVKEQVRQIAEVDLGDLVEETAGAVEKEQPSKVFLKTLGELFAVHMVWVDTADGRKESRSRAALVGKIADPKIPYISHAKDDTAINLSIPPALAAVQDSLRRQGRPPLNVSERTLITQLTADGLLLDEDNEPLDKNDKGVKTKQYRIDGERSRCVRIRIGEICESRMLMIPKED